MPANHTEIEKKLWDAADRLRANSKLKSSEYATPVLGLIFLRFADHKFNEDMERVIEEAELDEAQEKRLEREFAREYHLITRDDRLEKIAEDIVAHFMGRGQMGKAMVVSIDKATAVRMYDKVQRHWRQYLERLRLRLRVSGEDERKQLEAQIAFMQETDMAV